MIKFKHFDAGTYTDKEVTEFMNSHIIESKNFENTGAIGFLYYEFDDLELDTAAKVERIRNAIIAAGLEVYDAELGLIQVSGDLADVQDKISQTNPNDKEQWEALQASRKFFESQKTMHDKTIEGRSRDIFDLRELHKKLTSKK